MKDEMRVIKVDSFEQDLLINGMNEFRNKVIADGISTEDLDILLMKILDAPLLKKRRFEREDR